MKHEDNISHDLGNIWTGEGDEHHKFAFGEDVLVTRLGKINIVHTDRPDPATIRKRIDEVIHEEIDGDPFEDDCPLCQMMKDKPYDVVYSGYEY